MSPHLRGRVDLDKYGKACQRLENFIPSLQGPITHRPGTKRLVTLPLGKSRLIPFVSGAGSNYLIVLQDREISIYDTTGEKVGTVDETDYPLYTEEELDDVNYHQEVNELHLTHPNHPPSRLVIKEESPVPLTDNTGSELTDNEDSQLFALNSGNLLELDWYFERVSFKAHPFLPADQEASELRVHSAVEMLRVESSDPAEFSNIVFTGPDEQPRDIYLEYRVGDVWGLGRILGLNTVPAAPADPGGNQCYIEPVEKVVDIQDASATMYPAINDGTVPAFSPLLKFFGAEEGEGRVLCDTAVFETKHKNAWLRIPADRLFARRLPATPSTPFNQLDKYTGGDSERLPIWVKIKKYVGLVDYPVDFLTESNGVRDVTKYKSGDVYEVLRFSDVGTGPLQVRDVNSTVTATVNKENISNRRFTMNSTMTFGTLVDAGFYVANMSTQKQFDCVQFDVDGGFMFRRPKNDATSDVFVISPTGTLSVFSNRTDPLTDPAQKARHEGYLTASKATWDSPRDIGRFIHARLDKSWVLFQVKDVISPREVFCDLFTTLPTSDRTSDTENNGVFKEFRMGAWYEGNWPRAVSFYERRRVYAGTPSHPNLVWLSKMGEENQFDFRSHEDNGEVLDTTGIAYPLGTANMRIRWLSPGATLVVGSNSGEWQLRPNEFAGAVTPENIRIAEESQIGSLPLSLRIAGSVFFVDRSARALYEFYFDPQAQGFLVRTVTKLVDTLFDEDPIRRLHYQHFPHSAIWAVTQSGKMQGLVYRKEDDYYAWCTITTQGTIKDAAVLPRENNQEDQLWLLVERNDQLFLELMDDTLTTGYTDSAVTYPTVSEYDSTLSVGADFAEGDTVQVFIDDVFLGERTVDGDGNISLPSIMAGVMVYNGNQLVFNGISFTYNQEEAMRKVVVGYGYQSAAQLMPFAWEMQGKLAYGQLKRLVTVRPYLHRSSSYYMGMEESDMELLTPPQTPNYTGFDDERPIPGAQFSPEATPIIKQLRPEPLTVVSLTLKFDAN